MCHVVVTAGVASSCGRHIICIARQQSGNSQHLIQVVQWESTLLTQRGLKHNPHPAALVTQMLGPTLAKGAASEALSVAVLLKSQYTSTGAATECD